MKVLVVGGAGYIGSHMVKELNQCGYEVVTLDNLSTGWRDAIQYGEFIEGDVSDRRLLDKIFSSQKFEVVMHFASFIQVGESILEPAKYYRNNVCATQTLLDAMVAAGVNHFIFSSTAAVFGEPNYIPIDEEHPKQPINPYGRSKLIVEQMLEDYGKAYGLHHVSFRYFNAAGADPEGMLGERHEPETHLIPLLLEAASGKRETITVFGNDHDTADGTCIRDYVHVADLCSAHLLAIDYLHGGGMSTAFNLGNGSGYSINQVIEATRRVTQKEIKVAIGPRREGDPARLVADSSRAREELGWNPRFSDIDVIISHAWQWVTNSPAFYTKGACQEGSE